MRGGAVRAGGRAAARGGPCVHAGATKSAGSCGSGRGPTRGGPRPCAIDASFDGIVGLGVRCRAGGRGRGGGEGRRRRGGRRRESRGRSRGGKDALPTAPRRGGARIASATPPDRHPADDHGAGRRERGGGGRGGRRGVSSGRRRLGRTPPYLAPRVTQHAPLTAGPRALLPAAVRDGRSAARGAARGGAAARRGRGDGCTNGDSRRISTATAPHARRAPCRAPS